MINPEETIQTIFSLFNGLPDDAIDPVIELPAEDMHSLALDWARMNELLVGFREKFLTASSVAIAAANSVSRAFEQRDCVTDFLGRTMSRADFDAQMKAEKIAENSR